MGLNALSILTETGLAVPEGKMVDQTVDLIPHSWLWTDWTCLRTAAAGVPNLAGKPVHPRVQKSGGSGGDCLAAAGRV